MKLINEQIEEQREHFDNLELHIGYVYGSTKFPPNASAYTDKYVSEARLPPVWMRFPEDSSMKHPPAVDVSYVSEFGHDDVLARQYSTLDLCAPDAFALIVGPSSLWKPRIEQVKSHAWQHGIPINIQHLGTDLELVTGLQGDAWLDALQLKYGCGVFVRSDQHILMLLDANTTAAEVDTQLERHLAL